MRGMRLELCRERESRASRNVYVCVWARERSPSRERRDLIARRGVYVGSLSVVLVAHVWVREKNLEMWL